MRRGRFLLLTAALLGGFAFSGLAGVKVTLGEPYVLQLRFNVTAVNRGQAARNVEINLPVLVERDLPVYQRIIEGGAYTGTARFTLGSRGEAVFSLDQLNALGRVELNLAYRCEVRPISHRLPVLPRRSWPALPEAAAKYLGPAEGIEADQREIIEFARSKLGGRKDPVFQAKALYAATNLALNYNAEAGKTSALEALRRGRASCEGFARLFAALCRATGIPARLVYGLRLKQNESPAREYLADAARHVWCEVYLSGVGWVPVDPTFSYTVGGMRKVTYDYFGRLGYDGDVHVVIGYVEPKIAWTFRVPQGHPGLSVEQHLYVQPIDG
ncbi:MAG: transglutaminase-like domain-containing protein [Bacteroidota bacterium]